MPRTVAKLLKPRKPLIPRQPVDSSMLRSAGYDAKRRKLHLEFHNGGVYEYSMGKRAYEQFQAATSKGVHFQTHIRGLKARRIEL